MITRWIAGILTAAAASFWIAWLVMPRSYIGADGAIDMFKQTVFLAIAAGVWRCAVALEGMRSSKTDGVASE